MISGKRREIRRDQGFVLPLALMLVVVLSISGASFLQHDYLERRMTTTEWDHQMAFYLANAALERARESYKFSLSNNRPNWTTMLKGFDPVNYPKDDSPDPTFTCVSTSDPQSCLCPDTSLGCATPRFQTTHNPGVVNNRDPIYWPDIPIGDLFAASPGGNVFYSARAFDNDDADNPDDTDYDGRVIVRALGVVRGERKLLEALLQGYWIGLVNCAGPSLNDCPNDINSQAARGLSYLPSNPPRQIPLSAFPAFDYPLSDARNYYRDLSHFPSMSLPVPPLPSGDIKLMAAPDPTKPEQRALQNNTYYFTNSGEISIEDGTADNVVIFSTRKVTVKGAARLTNAIVISGTWVQIKSNAEIRAPRPHPAIISGGKVTDGDNALIQGTVYASPFVDPAAPLDPSNPVSEDDQGRVDLSGPRLHGIIFGRYVKLQGSGTVTDDGLSSYYDPMPGFSYSEEIKTTGVVNGTWREVR